MWHGLWPHLPEDRIPIGHITNGVHMATWLSRPMAALYGRYLKGDWTRHLDDPRTWRAIDQVDEEEFWEQHQILKTGLIDFVRRRLRAQQSARGQDTPTAGEPLDPSALTMGFARRFALYKRANLLLSDLDRLDRLVNHPTKPVQVIYAGKAHPHDEQAKQLIQAVFRITQDPRFRNRIVFLENHDINMARHLAQGVDLWLNTPRRPNEASGTSGQKTVFNGGLNLSTLDGWWAQAYDGANGFAIGHGGEHADPAHQDQGDAQSLFDILEQEVISLFYDRDQDGLPRGWIARQKNAIRTLAWRFCARRMVMDYTLQCYVPAAGGATSSFPGEQVV
jgi:starch phosphorylase